MPKIDKIVRVTSQISGGGVLRREFGIMLFVTTDNTLGTGNNRVATVANADDAAAVFDVGTEPLDAMNILYQQIPFPKPCVIGRWINSDVPAELLGRDFSSTFLILKAVSDGSFACKGEDFTALSLTTAVDLAGVAALIQTELRTGADADFAAATCVFNVIKNRFEVTTGTTVGTGVTLTVLSPVDPAVGTDLSALLSLDEGATLNQGADEETITEALNAIIAVDDSPYFVTVENTIVDFDTLNEVKTWVSARPYMFFNDNFELGALTPGESASVLAQFFLTQPERVVSIWSETKDYKGLSFAGRYSSVNFAQSNALITGNLKELPGTLADNINTTQQGALEEKYTNYYAPFFSAGSPSVNGVYNGTTMKPLVWADVKYFLDWAVNAVQVDVFNLLRNSNVVPQTEPGVSAIANVINSVMLTGIRNGGIAPGQVSAEMQLDIQLTTGNPDFDGFLTNGFLVYAPSIGSQSQSDRNQRKSPPFKVWMKGAGAIHSVEIALIFEN